MTWYWNRFNADNDIRIYDHTGSEISTSPVVNPDPPGYRSDSAGVVISPSFYDAVFDHLVAYFQANGHDAYLIRANYEITLNQIEEGTP